MEAPLHGVRSSRLLSRSLLASGSLMRSGGAPPYLRGSTVGRFSGPHRSPVFQSELQSYRSAKIERCRAIGWRSTNHGFDLVVSSTGKRACVQIVHIVAAANAELGIVVSRLNGQGLVDYTCGRSGCFSDLDVRWGQSASRYTSAASGNEGVCIHSNVRRSQGLITSAATI